MKNKKFSIVLLIVVTFIWGIIIIRIYKTYKSKPEETIASLPEIKKPEPKKEYVLVANYPDPFLGELKSERKPVDIKKPEPIQKPIEKIVWPSVSFKGILIKKIQPLNIVCLQLIIKP